MAQQARMGEPQEDHVVHASTVPSCGILLLATCCLLAAWIAAERPSAQSRPAQDQFASDRQYGRWNPASHPDCQKSVDQYNSVTPQIYAANAAKKYDERHTLTEQRQQYFDEYWKCMKSRRPLLQGSVTENAPGTPPSYPASQQIGSATQCGPQRGTSTNCPPHVAPWRGSGLVPALTLNGTRYSSERISVNIVNYVSMPERYQTEVHLGSAGNKAYTHAFGEVNTRRKTFTVTSVRDKSARDIPIPRPIGIRLR